jgi:hypothetical protein
METNPWKIGLRAARANLVPGLILQSAAFALLAAYYWLPAVHNALETVDAWQARYGIAFSLGSYLFFCGIVPYLFCIAMPSLHPKHPGKAFLFALGFWGTMGVIVPKFYELNLPVRQCADLRTLALNSSPTSADTRCFRLADRVARPP